MYQWILFKRYGEWKLLAYKLLWSFFLFFSPQYLTACLPLFVLFECVRTILCVSAFFLQIKNKREIFTAIIAYINAKASPLAFTNFIFHGNCCTHLCFSSLGFLHLKFQLCIDLHFSYFYFFVFKSFRRSFYWSLAGGFTAHCNKSSWNYANLMRLLQISDLF